jgi:hypothetical protein
MSIEKAHEKPLDIVIKTTVRDLYTFRQLQRDILKHSRLSGRVHVIVRPSQVSAYEKVVDPTFILNSTEDILKPFRSRRSLPDTWHTQQIFKLLAAGVVEHDYLILDANMLINFDFNEDHFYKGRRYLYVAGDPGDPSDHLWEMRTRKFLNLDPDGPLFGFRSMVQVFRKTNVLALINYMERLYGRNITDILDTPEETWTECKVYGYFCRAILENSGHFFQTSDDTACYHANKDISHFTSWIKFTRPLMIKLYKYRPTYHATDQEYDTAVERIKRAYE